jgi:hypothetical protein
MAPDYLWRLAEDLLVLAEDALDPTRTGIDLPDVRYVHHGQPVVEFCDGGVLSLWHDVIQTRQVGRNDAGQTQLVVTFFIDIWRCWPIGTHIPPSLETIQDAVKMLHIDAWCLVNGIQENLSRVVGCELVQYQEVRTLGPLGGMAGWRMPVTVGLNGVIPSFD